LSCELTHLVALSLKFLNNVDADSALKSIPRYPKLLANIAKFTFEFETIL
jgi:hypothetical protein